MIHPTAVIDPKAQVDPTVQVGPYVVIDAGVHVGADCVIGPHVHLTGHAVIGARNRFHSGAVIGDAPQDLRYKDAPTRLRIGDDNVFREHVTVHRSNKAEEDTVIGSGCFLMANAHIGHNSILGDHVIIANGTLLGGHVTVQDRAFISGNCLLHQFTRVGKLVLMQGGSGISKDLPPFTIARGINQICGLNVVGMRRAGVSAADRLELKKLYHHLFLSGQSVREALVSAEPLFQSEPGRLMMAFIREARRGVCVQYNRRASTDKGADDTE